MMGRAVLRLALVVFVCCLLWAFILAPIYALYRGGF